MEYKAKFIKYGALCFVLIAFTGCNLEKSSTSHSSQEKREIKHESAQSSVQRNVDTPWRIHTNKILGLSVEIPNDWIIGSGTVKRFSMPVQYTNFGPKESISGGLYWGITIFNKEEGSPIKKQIIYEIGEQFSDRQVEMTTYKTTSFDAELITVTTPSIPDWYSETILFQNKDKIFVIGNGAVQDPDFFRFVDSFKFLE